MGLHFVPTAGTPASVAPLFLNQAVISMRRFLDGLYRVSGAMAVFCLVMIVVFGAIAHGIYPKLRRHVEAQEWPQAAARLDTVRKLVAFNLVLGVLIVAAVKLM